MLKLIETQDGSPSIFSEKFDTGYHSKYGALQESRHVFIEGGLFYKAILQKELSILDIGFGTGLLAFLTYLQAEKISLKIHYTAVEAYPLPSEMAAELGYPKVLQAETHAPVFGEMHQAPWNSVTHFPNNFTFEKRLGMVEELDFSKPFDLIYYDVFAPSAQPELWGATMMQKMFEALRAEGILVTYCAKGDFKRSLKAVGFQVESPKGPAGKREMTRAVKH